MAVMLRSVSQPAYTCDLADASRRARAAAGVATEQANERGSVARWRVHRNIHWSRRTVCLCVPGRSTLEIRNPTGRSGHRSAAGRTRWICRGRRRMRRGRADRSARRSSRSYRRRIPTVGICPGIWITAAILLCARLQVLGRLLTARLQRVEFLLPAGLRIGGILLSALLPALHRAGPRRKAAAGRRAFPRKPSSAREPASSARSAAARIRIARKQNREADAAKHPQLPLHYFPPCLAGCLGRAGITFATAVANGIFFAPSGGVKVNRLSSGSMSKFQSAKSARN